MNLFIFGAGASYGADTNKSLVPPLAADLFNCLAKQYPDISNNSAVMSLAADFSKDFEQGLLKLYKCQPHFLSVFQRRMAHFFFQYGHTISIQQSNLYYRLAQEIKRKATLICLASLNYERTLEISFGAAEVQMVCNSAPKAGQAELCFPHGCCHLFCEGVRASAGGVSFSGMNISTNGPVSPIANPAAFEDRIRGDAFPPVMSYFEPTKVTTSGANFISAQRSRFKQLISEASKIAVIGIKIREHDEHIWQPLKDTSAKIIYCSGEEDAAQYETWRGDKPHRLNDLVIPSFWDAAFSTINSEMLQ
jgi:hypothetical protein